MGQLQRRLGVVGAAAIGMAAMTGSGVLFVWGPAAAVAGSWLLTSLGLAAIVAALNARSTAQLAMRIPRSGGVYTFATETVNSWFGFAAGWLFLTGKLASAAASALIAGLYLWPAAAPWVAAGIVAVLAAVNASGIRSTAVVSGAVLAVVVTGIVATLALGSATRTPMPLQIDEPGLLGVVQGAALVFFAFAGYARIATLGEEVRDPARTIPRAVILALTGALVLYTAVAIGCLVLLGVPALAASEAPLVDLAPSGWRPVVMVVAALAAAGSLLGVLAGLSRTSLAMARGGDLPRALARVADRTGAPVLAESVVAVAVILAVLLLDPLALVALSACAVLGYYAIAHLSAFRALPATQAAERTVPVVGGVLCLALAATLPWQSVALTLALLAAALIVRVVHRAFARRA